MNISLSPGYIPLFQKPNCCAAACMQMVVFRNTGILLDQEDVARELGLKITIPTAFREALPEMTRRGVDEGMHTVESTGVLNNFFRNHALDLCATGFRTRTIPDIRGFVAHQLEANRDVWVEYHTNEVFPKFSIREADTWLPSFRNIRWGYPVHDGLIESFDTETAASTVINPGPKSPSRSEMQLGTLLRSISDRYGRETGFVIIAPNPVPQPL